MLWSTVLALAVAATPATRPCSLITRTDVSRVLHWHVGAGHASRYHLSRASGALCTYEANEGTVLVTVPDEGSSFFQNNDLVDPFNNGLGTRVAGLGASVRIFDSTVYVGKGERSISIGVQSNEGGAEESWLTALAKVAVSRMR